MQDTFSFELQANVIFGNGSAARIGEIAARYGKKAMVVTCPWPDVQRETFNTVLKSLKDAGVSIILYDRACPNPTTTSIDEASGIGRDEGIDLVIGLGGGSAIDTAKAVSLGFAHEGGCWPYTYAVEKSLPIFPEKLLPVIAVTTTSGTGSHVTPYSILQNPELRRKTCIVATKSMIPTVAIVDPELMLSLPPYQTAVTGFDVFTHAFEAYVNDNSNPVIETLALRAIEITVENLIKVYKIGTDLSARYWMAFADTLAGICITLNNTTMPHDIGQAIVGKCPDLTHGQSLALVFPNYLECAMPIKVREFAKIARLFDPSVRDASDLQAAAELKSLVIQWMSDLKIYASGSSLGLPESVIDDVIEETMATCPFLTKLGKSRGQVTEIIWDIWRQV